MPGMVRVGDTWEAGEHDWGPQVGGWGADFLGVRSATLDGKMALHGRVGAWELLRGVGARVMECEHHEWLD